MTTPVAVAVAVAAAVAVVAGETLMFAAFLVGQLLLVRQGVPSASLGDPEVLSAVFAGGLYLAAIGLLAVGLGVVLRATAGALATLVGIILLVPALAGLFPSWSQGIFDYWPTLGGPAALTTVPDAAFPHPWLNLGGMCLAIAVLLGVAFTVFRRRDV